MIIPFLEGSFTGSRLGSGSLLLELLVLELHLGQLVRQLLLLLIQFGRPGLHGELDKYFF